MEHCSPRHPKDPFANYVSMRYELATLCTNRLIISIQTPSVYYFVPQPAATRLFSFTQTFLLRYTSHRLAYHYLRQAR